MSGRGRRPGRRGRSPERDGRTGAASGSSRKPSGPASRDREDYLLHKHIYQITPEEIKEMRELIKRFGQKLKNRISLRKKRVKHGGIDIKRTLRTSLQYGGVPFKIFHKDRKIDRPQLVVLCDISGSVNQYSRFMLLLTYTLQGLFSKVRTFAFISNMVEITPPVHGDGPGARAQLDIRRHQFHLRMGQQLREVLRPVHGGLQRFPDRARPRCWSWATAGTTTRTRAWTPLSG